MNVALAAFLVTMGTLLALMVLGVIIAIIGDYFNYRDLQKRLKRDQAQKKENP